MTSPRACMCAWIHNPKMPWDHGHWCPLYAPPPPPAPRLRCTCTLADGPAETVEAALHETDCEMYRAVNGMLEVAHERRNL